MKGFLYACEWIENDGPMTGPYVASRTHALWVPEAGILFQWSLPRGQVQVAEVPQFPPTGDRVRVKALGERSAPSTAVREARRYLQRQGHLQAQEVVVQSAMDRITDAAERNEGRFQAIVRAQIQT